MTKRLIIAALPGYTTAHPVGPEDALRADAYLVQARYWAQRANLFYRQMVQLGETEISLMRRYCRARIREAIAACDYGVAIGDPAVAEAAEEIWLYHEDKLDHIEEYVGRPLAD